MKDDRLKDFLMREIATVIMEMEHKKICEAMGLFDDGGAFRDYVGGVTEMGEALVERLNGVIAFIIEEYDRRQC